MPKLPSLTPQKVIAIIEKKGFVLKRVTGSHYIFAHPETKRRVTVPSHSDQVYSKRHTHTDFGRCRNKKRRA